MARFYGEVQGGRTAASRLGHACTGYRALVQGQHGGFTIQLFTNWPKDKGKNREAGEDYFVLEYHGGNCGSSSRVVAQGGISRVVARGKLNGDPTDWDVSPSLLDAWFEKRAREHMVKDDEPDIVPAWQPEED